MKVLNVVKNKSQLYLTGVKQLINNPHKISNLLSDDSRWLKSSQKNIIDRVKKPISWIYNTRVIKLSAEECQVRIQPLPAWYKGVCGERAYSALLYCAEEALDAFVSNAFSFNVQYKIKKAEICLGKRFIFPVDCVFSMDIKENERVERELKINGQCLQDLNLSVCKVGTAEGSEFGQIYIELEMFLPKMIPSRN